MEILQTIWTALTTENEVLINFTGFPMCLLDAFIVMLFFTTILNIKATNKMKVIYVLCFSILGFICRTFIKNPYGIILNMILLPMCVFFILKANFIKSIFAEIIPYAISLILETFFGKMLLLITKIPINSLLNIPIYRFLTMFLVYFSIYIFYKLAKKYDFSILIFEQVSKKRRKSLIINFVLSLLIIFFQFLLLNYYSDNLPLFITLLNIFCLVCYFIISLYSIFTASKLETTSINLEEAQLYNKTLQILHDNIRGFKHDFWNIVQGIGGYIDKNDIDGLKQYYSKLVEDCQQVNNLTALSPSVVNNPAIYNVLANKYHMADELGIKINLDVFMDLNELNINSYELTRIIGILMNNAIEASKECEEKIINVTFRKDKNKHMQLIIIENTYMDKNIDTEKIYSKGYSTKEGNTGLGLWEIRQIMKKHNNLNLYTTKTDEFFSQQFEIYY